MTRPDARAPVAYLDSSALIKLIVVEAESGALRRELTHRPRRTSSLVVHIEVTRAATRLGASTPVLAARVLSDLDLLSGRSNRARCTPDRRHAAALPGRHPARHRGMGALITYDRRMIAEGHALGLPVLTPA